LKSSTRTYITLAIGFTGAGLATAAGLPAGSLLGSALFVFIASCGNISGGVPTRFRTVGFAVIGCSLGSSLTKNFVDQALHWPLSLFVLSVSITLIMVFCSWILIRFFNQSAETAILSTSPGALSYTLSITAEGVGDARSIVIIQSIRILGLIIVLPLLLNQLPGSATQAAAGPGREVMGFGGFVVIFLITLGAGRFLERFRVPSSYLLTGTVVSGITHVLDIVSGRPSPAILFFGFAITGTVVGSRFSRISMRDLRSLLKVSLIIFITSSLLSALFAALTATILSLSFSEVFVAYAPGGVEAMAAMALSLGYDPAFVAGHHLFRIALLFVLVPLFLKLSCSIRQT